MGIFKERLWALTFTRKEPRYPIASATGHINQKGTAISNRVCDRHINQKGTAISNRDCNRHINQKETAISNRDCNRSNVGID